MSKNKNLTLILTAFLLLILCIFGYVILNKFVFNSSGGLIPQKVNLEYWGLYESELVMDEMIKEYEAQNPNVTINYVQKLAENDISGYRDTLVSRLKSGTGPAIFRSHSTWIPSLYNEISHENNALTPDQFKSRFYDIASTQCISKFGDIACIPIMYDGLILLYNVDILKSEGIDPQSIRSWEDLRVAAIRLTEYSGDENSSRRDITRAGVALGDPDNVVNTADILGLMFIQNGIRLPNDLDSQRAGLVFEFYTDFVKKDKVWSSSMPNSLAAFATGRTAMVFVKSSQILEILKLNPTVNLGAIPVPQLPQFGNSFTDNGWASFWVESVSGDLSDAEQKEAWKFLEWLSKEENQIKRFNLSSKYKRFGEPYSAKTLRNNLINSPLLGPVVLMAPTSRTSILTDKSGNDVYVRRFYEIVNAYLGGTDGSNRQELREKLKEDLNKL